MTHKTVKQITKAEAVEALLNGKVIKISVKLYKFKEVLMSSFNYYEDWEKFNLNIRIHLDFQKSSNFPSILLL